MEIWKRNRTTIHKFRFPDVTVQAASERLLPDTVYTSASAGPGRSYKISNSASASSQFARNSRISCQYPAPESPSSFIRSKVACMLRTSSNHTSCRIPHPYSPDSRPLSPPAHRAEPSHSRNSALPAGSSPWESRSAHIPPRGGPCLRGPRPLGGRMYMSR